MNNCYARGGGVSGKFWQRWHNSARSCSALAAPPALQCPPQKRLKGYRSFSADAFQDGYLAFSFENFPGNPSC